jgi:hypothetical protein
VVAQVRRLRRTRVSAACAAERGTQMQPGAAVFFPAESSTFVLASKIAVPGASGRRSAVRPSKGARASSARVTHHHV